MNNGVIVVGAGGHAKVCIEILRQMNHEVAYCIAEKGDPSHCLGVRVLHPVTPSLQSLKTKGYQKAFVAIGNNAARRRIGQELHDLGYEIINAISPHAILSPSIKLGRGIVVMPGSIVNADTIIEDFVIINTGATIDHDCHLGQACHIAPQCALAGTVNVGEESLLGVGCKVILNINIGNHVTAGAGSVIIRDIPNHVTAVGVPARIIKTTEKMSSLTSF